jgi:hypothetical protein
MKKTCKNAKKFQSTPLSEPIIKTSKARKIFGEQNEYP